MIGPRLKDGAAELDEIRPGIGALDAGPDVVVQRHLGQHGVDLALAATDMKTHEEHVRKAVAAIHEEVTTIPIWTMVSVFATKPNVDYTPTEKVRFILAMLKDVKVN